MPETYYAVGSLRREMEVESNLPFKIPFLKLKWADGQIGALPVFATLEEAKAWADGSPIIEVMPVGGDDAYQDPSDGGTHDG